MPETPICCNNPTLKTEILAVVNVKEIQFKTRFGSIAARELGNPDGEVVLALHGWLDNSATFHQLESFLCNHRLICLDLPGHGHSSWLPPAADYHIWTPVEAVIEIIHQFDSPVHLLGHSMGGAVALLIAATLPSHISSVISIDVFGPLTQLPGDVVDNFRQAIQLSSQKPARLFTNIDQAITARASAGRLSEETVRPIVLRNLREVDGGWQWRTDPRLRRRSHFRFTPDILNAFLTAIDCPVLIIRAKDGYLSQALIDERLALIKNASSVTVAGHHHCHLDPHYVNPVGECIVNFYR